MTPNAFNGHCPAADRAGDAASKSPAHFLYPGTLFTHPRSHRVTTVLGSCVAVCLWDRAAQIGGINHFLLPLWNGEGLSTPRYGNVAIVNLIEKMLHLGCRKSKLIAKVFGGAAMWSNPDGLLAVGERNVALARQLLREHRIPIVSSEVGGGVGRKILFDTGTGAILLRRCRTPRNPL